MGINAEVLPGEAKAVGVGDSAMMGKGAVDRRQAAKPNRVINTIDTRK